MIIHASSISYNDVSAAVALSNNEDTIIIPAGEILWTSILSIDQNIIIKGNGKENTIINFNYGTTQHAAFEFTSDGYWELSDITINVGSASTFAVKYNNYSESWRIHDCEFNEGGVKISKFCYGLIDTCDFIDCGVDIKFQHSLDSIYAGEDPLDGMGSYSWYLPAYLGTNKAVYVEDCVFNYINDTSGHPISGNDGARYVFRYNIINIFATAGNGIAMDAHGNFFDDRGTFSYEVYENTVNNYIANQFTGFNARGGQGVIYNNDLYNFGSGTFLHPILLQNYRSWYSEPYCTYPCADQINNLYIWNNNEDDINFDPIVKSDGDNQLCIQENRDYFLETKSGYTAYIYPHLLRGENMALTELQLPAKTSFYGNLQSAATQMDNLMKKWENLAEFIDFIDTDDLDSMGVAAGQVRTDLNQFKTVLNEVVAFFKGESTTQTYIPGDVVDKIRSM